MSYDLMVFRKDAAPKTKGEFMKWYQMQTEWSESHSYDDPANTSNELSNWFIDMIKVFPAMNGPFSSDDDYDENDDLISDYSIGQNVIYVGFRWSVAGEAYDKVLELAKKHNVGFFDASGGSADVLFSNSEQLIPLSSLKDNDEINVMNVSKKQWWRFW